jgi:hypothetical protein
MAPESDGIAISTFGKVIKSGWDWLGVTPAANAHVIGLVEAPELAACLTLSKNDFIRTGQRGATYLVYRKAIQEVVSRQLAAWGDAREHDTRARTSRLERDLERVLEDLANDFPLLRSLVDRRAGGQKRLPMPGRGSDRVPAPLFALIAGGEQTTVVESEFIEDAAAGPAEVTPPPGTPAPVEPAEPIPAPPPPASGNGQGDEQVSEEISSSGSTDATVSGRRRPARYGLLVQFASWPDDPELGRLVDNTVWINDAHPAYQRAVRSRSVGYHTALAVALSLAPLAVDRGNEHGFLTEFLAQWGAAEQGRLKKRRPRL